MRSGSLNDDHAVPALVGYLQPSPSLGPPLLSPSLSPPFCGMLWPAGQPSALVTGFLVVVVLGVEVGVLAFEGVLEEPHAVSAPTAKIEKAKSVKNGRITRILTSSPLLASRASPGRVTRFWCGRFALSAPGRPRWRGGARCRRSSRCSVGRLPRSRFPSFDP